MLFVIYICNSKKYELLNYIILSEFSVCLKVFRIKGKKKKRILNPFVKSIFCMLLKFVTQRRVVGPAALPFPRSLLRM